MSSSSGSKMMRARNLDANKPVTIYYSGDFPADLTQDLAPINRAVHPFSTGMEKEEENESHLQEAILARQANTAGISVENHVIPTPKVDPSSKSWYQKTYQPRPRPENLIRIQGSFGFDEELPEYDIDAEDEEWLATKYPIDELDFERIIELLENASSETQICLPSEAKSLLSRFDEGTANDVYDYWLKKRRKAVEKHQNCTLISRIRTEPKIGAVGANPYVAFRRRAEKMQTRKNRKNDEESFEKILKLKFDTKRAVFLFDLLKQRERTKYSLIDVLERVTDVRANLDEMEIASDPALAVPSTSYEYPSTKQSESVNKSPRKKRKALRLSLTENEAVNASTIQNNAEKWENLSSMGMSSPPHVPSTSSYDNPKAFQIDSNSEYDGKYEFVRRRGCVYRAPLPKPQNPDDEPEFRPPHPNRRFYEVELRNDRGEKTKVFGRSRLSRTGKVLDVLSDPVEEIDPYIDTSRSFRARTPRSDEEEDMDTSVPDRENGRNLSEDDLSEMEPMTSYVDNPGLENWVKRESRFFTVNGKQRVPVIPAARPESDEDFFQKPPTTTSREPEQPMNPPPPVSNENAQIRPSLARLNPDDSNRELQVPAPLTAKKRTAIVAPFSCPISPSGSSVVATGSPPEQSVEIQSTRLTSASFDVVPSIKTFALEEKSSEWTSDCVKFSHF